jgi:hypothetical protein
VTRPSLFRSRLPSARGFHCRGLGLLLALCASACGPQGASPMPEPPSIDGGLIGPAPVGISILSEPHAVPIVGAPGAATAGAGVRVLNLDLDLPAATATAAADGSFATSVLASPGNELRFEAVQQGQRSAPADLLYTSQDGDQLSPSPRYDCLSLVPGFDLDVPLSGTATVQLHNGCPEPLTFDAPRFRSGGDFMLDTPLPLVVAAGGVGELQLQLTAATGAAEDVLFVDASRAAQTLRYPIGLFRAE